MIEIIPAVMPRTYEDLEERSGVVASVAPLLQVDVMDGVFVQGKTWPYVGGGPDSEKRFLTLRRQEEGFPHWEVLDYELDLMIAEPERHMEEWLPLGASRLVFHIESIRDRELFFSSDLLRRETREIGGEVAIAVGLAITPGTPVEELLPWVPKADFIQVMGIARIGRQGEPFDDRALEMVNALRVKYPSLPISVDGGVRSENVQDLVRAGATRLVAGTAIFRAEDPAEALADLTAEANDVLGDVSIDPGR
jgi:ribulose-phosphate 3-epimerase